MTLISYAQNFEDVLLWRALGHVKNGFYIDVGANDPVEHSVTKAFYDAGWYGINIEPLPAFHQAFLEQRPRDINLAIAAGASEGNITLFDVPSVNGWASPDAAVAEAHRADGFEVRELTVPMRTLDSICAEHVRTEIHFLKVDVEGFEGEVLRGLDLARWRPWILVVEATLPNSRVTNHAAWEALVTGQRYHYAWFDGLNRYYVADEHKELLAALSTPPNVFDDFMSHHLDKAWKATRAEKRAGEEARQRAASAEGKQWDAEKRSEAAISAAHQASQAATEASDLSNLMFEKFEHASARAQQELLDKLAAHERVAALEHELLAARTNGHNASLWARELEQKLIATQHSTSWRITRPVRALGALAHQLRRPGLLRRIVVRVTANERMRRLLIPVLLRFPSINQRVSQTVSALKQGAPEPVAPDDIAVPEELRAMPASARKVLADLKRVRERAKGQ